jgi:alcohol dehydrogenase
MLPPNNFNFNARTRVVFGDGSLEQAGELARELGFTRTLVVSDHGVEQAGYVERALKSLSAAGVTGRPFLEFDCNPDTAMVERGRAAAAEFECDSIIGLGGGSSMDCAKGINFVHSNGGSMRDYWGHGKATKPMLPMIGIPTTAGTGSEAQSYAIISDSDTHVKMACGDEKAAFRIAILDPAVTQSAPRTVTAAAGYDALSHAVETYVTTKGNLLSRGFARLAFEWIEPQLERVLNDPQDGPAHAAMMLGANVAGMAIEHSMLGAAHACANPLTARFGIIHGVAVSLMLPHVVRWNAAQMDYSALYSGDLPARLIELAKACGMPATLKEAGVDADALEALAEGAGQQWTGRFNPRPFDAKAALELYRCAYE